VIEGAPRSSYIRRGGKGNSEKNFYKKKKNRKGISGGEGQSGDKSGKFAPSYRHGRSDKKAGDGIRDGNPGNL